MTKTRERAEKNWPPVVVGGAYNTGVGLMKHLSQRGVSVCCIDNNSTQPGFKTIYGKAYKCPNPNYSSDEWRDFMIDLSRKLGAKPVFIPSADRFVSGLSKNVDALSEHYHFHQESIVVQGLFATKQRQYEIAAEHGMPIPLTHYVQSMTEVEAFADLASFPCLLKPLSSAEWQPLPVGHPLREKKLIFAANRAELRSAYLRASAINPRVVVQEVIEGPDTAKSVYLSCYGKDHRRLGSCVLRELRTSPINYGSASVVEPVIDEEVDTVCDRLLRGVGYVGLCEIEVKRDTRDGRVKMIEANPRYSVTADAGPYAGVDLGWIHYLDVIGQQVEPVTWNGRDFRHISLHRDFSCIRPYQRAGLETWGTILHSYRSPRFFFDLDWRDWKVATNTCLDLARIVVGSIVREIIPKRPTQTHVEAPVARLDFDLEPAVETAGIGQEQAGRLLPSDSVTAQGDSSQPAKSLRTDVLTDEPSQN